MMDIRGADLPLLVSLDRLLEEKTSAVPPSACT
jgi:hypothetical protein